MYSHGDDDIHGDDIHDDGGEDISDMNSMARIQCLGNMDRMLGSWGSMGSQMA